MMGHSIDTETGHGFGMLNRRLASGLLFVAVGAGVYACLEGLNYITVRTGDGFTQSLNAYRHAGPIEGIIAGDSHPAYDVDPEVLGTGWHNFAYPGENLIMTYYKLKYILDEGQRPAYLVLPLDYHSLSSYRIDGADYSNYLDFDRNGDMRRMIGLKAWVRSLVKKHLPLTSRFNRQQFVEYMMKRLRSLWTGGPGVSRSFAVRPHGQLVSLREGFAAKSPAERARVAAARYREQMAPPLVHRLLVEYFRRILELCEDYGIVLIGVRFPLSGPYAELLQAGREFGEVARVYDQERWRFAAIKNYERLYVAWDDYFSDADHLNAQGSAAFSKVLASDLDGVLKRMPRS